MKIDQLMERLGDSGVTILLKVDHERMEEGGEPWTLVMSGPGLGGRSFIRAETTSLDDCIKQGVAQLRDCPGDWSWLAEVAR